MTKKKATARRTTSIEDNERRLRRILLLEEELSGESDRAIAVVGVSWIEEALLAAIESVLLPHKKSGDLFDPGRPLGSFQARVHLARSLGLISDEIVKDLANIGQIRNRFAHRILHDDDSKLSFDNEEIKKKCLGLACIQHRALTDAKNSFIQACAQLNADLEISSLFSGEIKLNYGMVSAKGKDA